MTQSSQTVTFYRHSSALDEQAAGRSGPRSVARMSLIDARYKVPRLPFGARAR